MNTPFFKANLYQTKGIAIAAKENNIFFFEIMEDINRFYQHDWGDMDKEDKLLNDEDVTLRNRVLAAYDTSKGRIYIIADATDKNYYETITVLFADEY